MIDVSEIVSDSDFAQDFEIQRSSGGSWKAGVWVNETETVPGYGIVQPATPEELDQVPEGDRVRGSLSFHSEDPLFETHTRGTNDTFAGTSDIICHRGQKYRLVKVWQWEDFGYFHAIGARISGQ
jgi:hypothetical protein